MSKHLADADLTPMRDTYLQLLGFSPDKPVWLGLQVNGRDVCTRRVCPVIEVTPSHVEWAPRELHTPKRWPWQKWWQPDKQERVTVVVSPTPAGSKAYPVATVFVGNKGTVRADKIRLGVSG